MRWIQTENLQLVNLDFIESIYTEKKTDDAWIVLAESHDSIYPLKSFKAKESCIAYCEHLYEML